MLEVWFDLTIDFNRDLVFELAAVCSHFCLISTCRHSLEYEDRFESEHGFLRPVIQLRIFFKYMIRPLLELCS